MPRSRPAMLAAAILIALSWLAIAALAPRQYPLHHDTPANFWFSITGVKLPSAPTPNFHGNFAIIDRDRIVYGYEYPFTPAPDMPYQMVSIDEAARDFPAVERELKRRAALHNPDDYPAEGFQHWSASEARELAAGTGYTPTTDYRIRTLLPSIDQARSEWKLTDVDDFQYAAPAYTNFQTGLVHVADAARLYWATIAFEALLFPALILFALWPFIHRQRFRRKLLHITLLPLLLYLPAWLGYCNSASPAYPVGGIIYPCVNWPSYAPLDNFLWEFGFLSHLPPIFYPITQGRTLTYADYYTWKPSIPYQLGPVNVAIFCAVAAACCLAIKAAHTLYHKRRRAIPGFPVLPHDPATAAPPTLSSSPRT